MSAAVKTAYINPDWNEKSKLPKVNGEQLEWGVNAFSGLDAADAAGATEAVYYTGNAGTAAVPVSLAELTNIRNIGSIPLTAFIDSAKNTDTHDYKSTVFSRSTSVAAKGTGFITGTAEQTVAGFKNLTGTGLAGTPEQPEINIYGGSASLAILDKVTLAAGTETYTGSLKFTQKGGGTLNLNNCTSVTVGNQTTAQEQDGKSHLVHLLQDNIPNPGAGLANGVRLRVKQFANTLIGSGNSNANGSFENVNINGGTILAVNGGEFVHSYSKTMKKETFDIDRDPDGNFLLQSRVGDSPIDFLHVSESDLNTFYDKNVKSGVTYYTLKSDPAKVYTPANTCVLTNRNASFSEKENAKGKITIAGNAVVEKKINGFKNVVFSGGATVNDTISGGMNSEQFTDKVSTASKNITSGGVAYASRTVASAYNRKDIFAADGSFSANAGTASVILLQDVRGYKNMTLNGESITLGDPWAVFSGGQQTNSSTKTETLLYRGTADAMRQDYQNYTSFGSAGAAITRKLVNSSRLDINSQNATGAINVNQIKNYSAENKTVPGSIDGYANVKIKSAFTRGINAGYSYYKDEEKYALTTKNGFDTLTQTSGSIEKDGMPAGTVQLENAEALGGIQYFKNLTLINASAGRLETIASGHVLHDEKSIWTGLTENDSSYDSRNGSYDLSTGSAKISSGSYANKRSYASSFNQSCYNLGGTMLKTSGATRINGEVNNVETINLGAGTRITSTVSMDTETFSEKAVYSKTLKAGAGGDSVLEKVNFSLSSGGANNKGKITAGAGVQIDDGISGYMNVTLSSGAAVLRGIQNDSIGKTVSSSFSSALTLFDSGAIVSGIVNPDAAVVERKEYTSAFNSSSWAANGSLKAEDARIGGDIYGYTNVSLNRVGLTENAGGASLTGGSSGEKKSSVTSASVDSNGNASAYDLYHATTDSTFKAAGKAAILNNNTNTEAIISGFQTVNLTGGTGNLQSTIRGGATVSNSTEIDFRKTKASGENWAVSYTKDTKETAAGSVTAKNVGITGVAGYATVNISGSAEDQALCGGASSVKVARSVKLTGVSDNNAWNVPDWDTQIQTNCWYNVKWDNSAMAQVKEWSLSLSGKDEASGSYTVGNVFATDATDGDVIGFKNVSMTNAGFTGARNIDGGSNYSDILITGNFGTPAGASGTIKWESVGAFKAVGSTAGYVAGYASVTIGGGSVFGNISGGKSVENVSALEWNMIGSFYTFKTTKTTSVSGTISITDSKVKDVRDFQKVTINGTSECADVGRYADSMGTISVTLGKNANVSMNSLYQTDNVTLGENAALRVVGGYIGTDWHDTISVGKNARFSVFNTLRFDVGVDTLKLTNAASASNFGSVFGTDAAFNKWELEKITGKGSVVCRETDVESVRNIADAGVDVIGSTNFSASTSVENSVDSPLSTGGDNWLGYCNTTDYYQLDAGEKITFSAASGLDGIRMEISTDNGQNWIAYENGGISADSAKVRLGFEDEQARVSFDYTAVIA